MKKNIYLLGVLPLCLWCFGNVAAQHSAPNRETVVAETQVVGKNIVPENPPISGKGEQVQAFNKVPVYSAKITNIEEILNSQSLLDALGINNGVVNIFLLTMVPAIGRNCNVLKKGTNAAMFIFNTFPCYVFQIAEGNRSLKDFWAREKIPFTEWEDYVIVTGKREHLDLILREKDLSKSLVASTKQPLDAGQLEFSFNFSKILEFLNQRDYEVLQLLFGKELLDSSGEIKFCVGLDSMGVCIRTADVFDKVSSLCSKLKGGNCEKLSLNKYVETKDASTIIFMKNFTWILGALEALIGTGKIVEKINMDCSQFMEKLLDFTRKLFSPYEVFMCISNTFQERNANSFSYKISGQLPLEKFLESYVSEVNNFQKFFNEKMVMEHFSALNLGKDKEILKLNCQYRFVSEYKGYKIYSLTTNPEFFLDFLNLTRVTLEKPKFIGGSSEYMAFVDDQILSSDTLDDLKTTIDNVVAKKLPTVGVESFMDGISEGTLLKLKIDLKKKIESILVLNAHPEMVESIPALNAHPGLKKIKDIIILILEDALASGAVKGGNITANLEVGDDRLQFNLSLDFASIGTLIAIVGETIKLFNEEQEERQRLQQEILESAQRAERARAMDKNLESLEAPQNAEPPKAEENKEPILPEIAYIYKFEDRGQDNEHPILIPVKIVAEYKAFC